MLLKFVPFHSRLRPVFLSSVFLYACCFCFCLAQYFLSRFFYSNPTQSQTGFSETLQLGFMPQSEDMHLSGHVTLMSNKLATITKPITGSC